jgi:hypothetical protein
MLNSKQYIHKSDNKTYFMPEIAQSDIPTCNL